MTSRKINGPGILKKKHYIVLSGEPALEEAIDLPRNEYYENRWLRTYRLTGTVIAQSV
jgi:hypothetical protein